MRRWFATSDIGRFAAVAASLALASCTAGWPTPSPLPPDASATATPGATTAASMTASPSPVVSPSSSAATGADSWQVVAIGDSIPFNSPDDCPGCIGFVSGYASRLQQATGHPVAAINLSQHNGLQASGLAPELASGSQRGDAIADADVVIVSIGHNDTPWNSNDDTCDRAYQWNDPVGSNVPAAKKYTKACAEASAAAYEPTLRSIYRQVVGLREGKPTVFLALDTYNDILGWCEQRGCDGGKVKVTPPRSSGPRALRWSRGTA